MPGRKLRRVAYFSPERSGRVVTVIEKSRFLPERTQPMIETIVDSIRVNLVTQSRVVFLREVNGDRHVPIWIGVFEAHGIAMELQGNPSPRPLPWDLLKSLIAELNRTIERVVVNDLSQDVFFARIVVEISGRSIVIDSRPSDAIALAVRARCPILVEDLVMDRAGVSMDAELEGDDESPVSAEGTEQQRVPEDERLEVFRDFINTLDLDDFEKRRGS
jgi:bifunctional DNase/RNase